MAVIKVTAPRIEETSTKCKEKMVRWTEAPAWARLPARAEYTVPPVPEPASTIDDTSRSKTDGGSSQKFILCIQGNAKLSAPVITETSQFLNLPIIICVTIKKIMTNACSDYIMDLVSSKQHSVGLAQHGLMDLKWRLLFQFKHQIIKS